MLDMEFHFATISYNKRDGTIRAMHICTCVLAISIQCYVLFLVTDGTCKERIITIDDFKVGAYIKLQQLEQVKRLGITYVVMFQLLFLGMPDLYLTPVDLHGSLLFTSMSHLDTPQKCPFPCICRQCCPRLPQGILRTIV